LKESGIPYTIFRLTGFYQGLIEQYAIPILESLPIWLPMRTHIFHIWIQDIAKFCLRALQTSDHKSDVSFRWIARLGLIRNYLCEQLAGQQAKSKRIPLFFLKFVSRFGF
jgi:hypothetical protein